VNGSAWGAWLKLDLTERGLVVGYVLLQERHQRLGLLRAEINSLKISQFYLRFRALLHGPEDEEKIPDVYTDLHTIGVSLAVIFGLNELYIRLIDCIHMSKCNAGAEVRAKSASVFPRNILRRILCIDRFMLPSLAEERGLCG